LNSRIPLVRTSSELAVRRLGSGRSLSTPFRSRHAAVRPRREARVDHRQPRVSECRPLGPALRANPFPEVLTDPFCRLPLSTLFYRLEAVHLGDLMRLWVRPGKIGNAPPDFQGPSLARRTPRKVRCFTSF
ncbi:hypothetical protein CHLNCDRAFT_20144, partial [Chlorella variabilis]